MLTLDQRLRPRQEEVAAKVIDGEAIIINLANGVYYSMDKVGALIWEMIESKHSLAEMGETISRRYAVSSEQAEADVRRLTEELLEETLVVLSNDEATRLNDGTEGQQESLAYESPALNIYRDMGDLLALDPPVPGLGDTPWKEPESEPTDGSNK